MVRWTRPNSTVEKSSLDLSQIFDPIRADLEKVDREFGRHVQSQIDLIPKIGQYIQTSGGKRMRPALLLMASRLCGYEGDRAIVYAAVVEFIHTATLVHDDIIDGSELRRGRLAVHSRWGNDITVLLGDYLYIKSMAMALTHDELQIIRLLCDVTLRMIEGELFQLTKNGDAARRRALSAGARRSAACSRRCPASTSRRCASTVSTSAWHFSSSTTCSTSP